MRFGYLLFGCLLFVICYLLFVWLFVKRLFVYAVHASDLFLYPLKILESQSFSDTFWKYMETLRHEMAH